MDEAVFVKPSTIHMMERMQKKLEELMSKEEYKQFIHEINKEAFMMDIESLTQAREVLLDISKKITSGGTSDENS